MAKSVKAEATTKKTGNRRMKRTVRRTIGALCMVSAITVAAIPVPDIEAYSPTADPVATYASLNVLTTDANDELTNAASNKNLTMESAGFPASRLTNHGKTYTLNTSAGVTYLDWQFEYASEGAAADSTYPNAFITDYNNNFSKGELDLSSGLLFSDYVTFGLSSFEGLADNNDTAVYDPAVPNDPSYYITVNFKIGDDDQSAKVEKLGLKYVLSGDPRTMDTSSTVYKFFSDYFPTDLANQIQKYNDEDAKYAEDNTYTRVYPPDLERRKMMNSSFDDPEEQQRYMLNEVFGNGANFGLALSPTTKYKYKADGSRDGTEPMYIVHADSVDVRKQFTPSKNYGHILYTDSQGYVVAKFIQLIGIGEKALKGVVNITNITLGSDIQFVCDEAFSGSNVLSSVTFGGNATIGNRSFYKCDNLTNVVLSGVQGIGKESFAKTKISSISIPESLVAVEDGAFYNCTRLANVTFENEGTSPTTIGKAAFCDLEQLNTVDFGNRNINSIGDYAFAITDTSLIGKDKLKNFKYPDYITTGPQLGEFTLANRQALETVTLSTGLRPSGIDPEVPDTIVANCPKLQYFRFPVGTNGVSYDPTMFYDVTNPDFYVWGPERNLSDYAVPRECTWQARMDVAANAPDGLPVTYKYYKDDNESNPATYEISNGKLIQGIDATGKLVNCTYVPGLSAAEKKTDLQIPSSVAGITINAIDSNCFNDELRANITGIEIADGNGIATIEDNVFKDFDEATYISLGDGVRDIGASAFEGCGKVRKVDIGQNISSIGANAFHDCTSLTEIRFDKPTNMGDLLPTDIGENALSTGSDKLTVYGEIGENYGPFAWSMDPDNFVDQEAGIRVCYKTNSPSNMTIILDNTNGLPTLVDYPHLDQLDDYARAAGLGYIDGPTPGVKIPDPSYSLVDRVKTGASLSNTEQELVNAVRNIVIPSGIKSIDVKGYITRPATSTGYSNAKNVDVYLDPLKATDADGNPAGLDYFDTYKAYGLFNGYYGKDKNDYTLTEPDAYFMQKLGDSTAKAGQLKSNAPYDNNNKDSNPSGNDVVESVIMETVEYLPDLAFYNCENLEILSLGSAMDDVGELPIADCTKLNSLACGGNKYEAINGILYEKLDNGKKKIVECFPGQGNVVGSNDISTDNHPELSNVSDIAEGAFANCDEIYFADLTGIQDTEIPEYCFYDCDKLKNVTVPENMDNIRANAFGEDPSISLDIKNPDLTPDRDAFGDFENGENPYIYTTKGSIVERLSKAYGENKLPAIIRYTDEWFTVIFRCNLDGKELYRERVQDGDNPDGPDSDDQRAHEDTFGDKHDGYEFAYWADEDGNEITNLRRVAITKNNTIFLGIYTPKKNVTPSPDVSGDVTPTPGSNTPGGTTGGASNTTPSTTGGSKGGGTTKYPLTVVYGSGSGNYPEGTKVIIEAIDAPAGKVFDKWVVTGAAATVYSSTSKATTVTTAAGETIITATYKDASSGGGGSSSDGGGATGTKTSTGTHNRTGADGSPAAGTGSSTRVDITKPGISDVDKAYASVSGSTDSFVVKITESADADNAVATALANKYGDMTPIKYFAMDISLYDATGTNKITDTTGLKVNVTMPIPDALRQYAGNNKVGAVVNGTQLEDLACKFTTVDGIPCVSFTATHFSPYTIYVDTNNLQVGLMDTSPKTGDPIHPKWFVTIALAATSLFLFLKRDKVTIPAKA